jgi:hypothetical protein
LPSYKKSPEDSKESSGLGWLLGLTLTGIAAIWGGSYLIPKISPIVHLITEEVHEANHPESLLEILVKEYPSIPEDTKSRLIDLSKGIKRNIWRIRFADYAQEGNNLWVIGAYMNWGDEKKGGNLLFYSPGKESKWSIQLNSDISISPRGHLWMSEDGRCLLPRIRFMDSENGMAVMDNGISYTRDGGRNWTLYTNQR